MSKGPSPAVEFRADDGDGAQALHREHVEDDEGGRRGGGEQGATGSRMGFLGEACFEVADLGGGAVGGGVKGLDGADEDFAGGEGAQDGDAEAAVVAERGDDGFDGVADGAEDARFEALCGIHGLPLGEGAGAKEPEAPKHHAQDQDDLAGGAQEDRALADHVARHEGELGEPVGRPLFCEFAALGVLGEVAVEEPGHDEGGRRAGEVQPVQEKALSVEPEDSAVGNDKRDEEGVNREAVPSTSSWA